MKFFRLLTGRRSAPLARERLQILLTHERVAASQSDLLPTLRDQRASVTSEVRFLGDDRTDDDADDAGDNQFLDH